MRGPAAALAFGLGLGLPCLLAVGAAAFGWDVRGEVYGALCGLGFAAGLVVAAIVDGMLYKAEKDSQLRQRDALTDATLVANQEREARLRPAELPAPEIDLAEEDEWYTHTLRPLFTNGHRAGGFSWTALARTMIQDDWERLCKFYCGPEGRRVLRLEPGNVGYVLNTPTWSHADVMRAIAAHTLPHPEGLAPDVETLTDDAARRASRRGETVGVGGF